MTYMFVVPTDLCQAVDVGEPIFSQASESRSMQFLRLPHPRTGVPSLFLPHTVISKSGANSSSSILEVQAVAPHSSRSWFLEGNQVISDGKLLLMTPIDPLFLLIPILRAAQPEDGTVGSFRPMDDIFEEAALRFSRAKEYAIRSQDITQMATLLCVRTALTRICDYKEITEELSVFRFSRSKLMRSLSVKIAYLSQPDVFDGHPSLQRQLARNGLLDSNKDALRQDGRTRAAYEVISQYIPQDIANELLALHDFTSLDAHLRTLTEEPSVVAPPRLAPVPEENDNEKKRKAMSQISKGVSKLMKVNTSGMAKISTFFKKPTK